MTKAEKMVWASSFAAVCAESARGYAGDAISVTLMEKRATEVAAIAVQVFRGVDPQEPLTTIAQAYLREMHEHDE